MVGVVSDLYLETGCFFHGLDVVGVQSQCVLEAFGCFGKIFFLFVDAGTGMPAEHAFHFAFYEGQLGHFQGFCFFSQSLQEQGLKGIGFGMVGVDFKKFFCVLETFFIVLGVVEFLCGEGDTASCL